MKARQVVNNLLEAVGPDDPSTFLKHYAGPTKVMTTWEIIRYEVWGNEEDGFEVNDAHRVGKVDVELDIQTHNVGTSREFQSAAMTDEQVKEALGLDCDIETSGDDLLYTVDDADGRPIGELRCISHDSLSPIR